MGPLPRLNALEKQEIWLRQNYKTKIGVWKAQNRKNSENMAYKDNWKSWKKAKLVRKRRPPNRSRDIQEELSFNNMEVLAVVDWNPFQYLQLIVHFWGWLMKTKIFWIESLRRPNRGLTQEEKDFFFLCQFWNKTIRSNEWRHDIGQKPIETPEKWRKMRPKLAKEKPSVRQKS